MSFSEGLKYAEGARKKIIREWAEENCFDSIPLLLWLSTTRHSKNGILWKRF